MFCDVHHPNSRSTAFGLETPPGKSLQSIDNNSAASGVFQSELQRISAQYKIREIKFQQSATQTDQTQSTKEQQTKKNCI